MQNITNEQFKNFKALLYLKRPYLSKNNKYSIAQQLSFAIIDYLIENGFTCNNDTAIYFNISAYAEKEALVLKKDKYSFTLVIESDNNNKSPSWYINIYESGRIPLCNTSFILYLFDEHIIKI